MSHFDTVLQDLLEKVARKRKLENVMTELRAQRSELFTQVDRLDALRMKEQADVDKLEGGSLAAFFYNVIGKMDERLERPMPPPCAMTQPFGSWKRWSRIFAVISKRCVG